MSYEGPQLPIGGCLWQQFDSPTPDVGVIIDSLERAVSQGFFGLAAELCDRLSALHGDLLTEHPAYRVRIELERLKRTSYMGYTESVKAAAAKVLFSIKEERGRLPAREAALWERTALGFRGWASTDPAELATDIARCHEIHKELAELQPVPIEQEAFLLGLIGRAHCLIGETKAGLDLFARGAQQMWDNKRFRSWSHLQVRFAEHCDAAGESERAASIARTFLDEAARLQFRSHLSLRAVHLLLHASPEIVPDEERRQMRFRWEVLVHAFGVSRSRTAFPLLERILADSAIFSWDDLEFDFRAQLRAWLAQRTPEEMESVLAAYYRAEGYAVHMLEEGAAALDIYAVGQPVSGFWHAIGIQVKHWGSRLTKERLPDEDGFADALERIKALPNGKVPQALHWYCGSAISGPAQRLLERRAKQCLGNGCQVLCTDLNDLVDRLVRRPEIVPEVVFRVQISNLPSRPPGKSPRRRNP